MERMSDSETLLVEQTLYYRERASEYDDWWFRRGRYDRGAEANARWFADIAALEEALQHFGPSGDVLELACGTGLWTRHLTRHARRVTAVDSSPEVLRINRERVADERVSYLEADLFAWEPECSYDVCFFSFWLSHVPEERFAEFWEKVGRAVGSKGRVLFLDSSHSDLSSAADRRPSDHSDDVMVRRLADGR